MSVGLTRRGFLYRAGRLGLGAAGLALLGGCVLNQRRGPGGAPAARVATIGYLASGLDEEATDGSSNSDDLRQGLRELGWVEGENVRFEIRTGGGNFTELRDDAAELADLPVDLIVTRGVGSAVAAAAATRTRPVVMVYGPPDPVERGLAASIQRPDGNVTGNVQPPYEIYGKRLELLVEAVPHVSRVACIVSGSPTTAEALRDWARTLGVQVDLITPRSERDLELAFEAIDRAAADAVVVQGTAVTLSHRARIVDFVAQRRLPAMYHHRGWAEAGGLMSYGVDVAESHRRAATYVDRILRGARPGDLPIEYPTQYELVINLRTAAALGLPIPDSLLAQATEVIR